MKKLQRLNVILMLLILASCSNKASIREEVYYYDEEKTIVSSKESYCDSVLENGYEISFLHGEQIEYYENGKIRRKSNYNFDQLNGLQFQFTPEGDTASVVSFLNGALDGINITAIDGYRTVSNYSSGSLNGNYLKYRTYNEDRVDTVEHGQYKMGKKEGVWIESVLAHGLNHRFEGKHIYTYDNGIKNGYCRFLSGWEGMVVNGRMDGRWVNSLDSTLSILIDNGELIAEEIKGRDKPSIETKGYLSDGYLSRSYGLYVETRRVKEDGYIGYEYQEIAVNLLDSVYREDHWDIVEEKNYRKHTIVSNFEMSSPLQSVEGVLGKYYSSSSLESHERTDSVIVDFRYNVILNVSTTKLDYWGKKKKQEWLRENHGYELRKLVRKNYHRDVRIKEYPISEIQDTGLFNYPKVRIDSENEINCVVSFVAGKVDTYFSKRHPRCYKYNFYIDSEFNCYRKEDSKIGRNSSINRGEIIEVQCLEKRYVEEEKTVYLIVESSRNFEAWVINLNNRTISIIQTHCFTVDAYRAFWGQKDVDRKFVFYSADVEECRFMLEENEEFGFNHLVLEKLKSIKQPSFNYDVVEKEDL